jgi:hypothetical protein
MARPLTKRELSEEILFGPRRSTSAAYRHDYSDLHKELALGNGGFIRIADERSLRVHEASLPYLVPAAEPKRSARKAPLMVRINRLLQIALLACCGLALVGYGLDVTVSTDVVRMQEQARRLSEQNSELSAELLKSISFQGIQESALGKVGLRVPDKVVIAPEVQPVKAPPFKPSKYYLPLMSGY